MGIPHRAKHAVRKVRNIVCQENTNFGMPKDTQTKKEQKNGNIF